jgi:hypothetical protein
MDDSAVATYFKIKEPVTLQALTIIDLNMHFMEIVALQNKENITIVHTLNQVWLCRYPHLIDCLHENGTEFISAKFQEFLQSYGIQSKLTTVKTPQANSILECTHQVIRNLLHSSCLIAQDFNTVCRTTRTSHASNVGHQHNIPYNLKGKPSSTCIQS